MGEGSPTTRDFGDNSRSAICAGAPIVGRYLEPLGGAAAMGAWGFRAVPEFLAAAAKSQSKPRVAQEPDSVTKVFDAALHGIMSPTDLPVEWTSAKKVI